MTKHKQPILFGSTEFWQVYSYTDGTLFAVPHVNNLKGENNLDGWIIRDSSNPKHLKAEEAYRKQQRLEIARRYGDENKK